MARTNQPISNVEQMSAVDRLAAITWEADRRGVSYGKFVVHCSQEERSRILEEYLSYLHEKHRAESEWLEIQRGKKASQDELRKRRRRPALDID